MRHPWARFRSASCSRAIGRAVHRRGDHRDTCSIAIAQAPQRHVWISLLPRERVLAIRAALESQSPDSLPLYGVPFAIKDNIDLEGVVDHGRMS